ncbi:MAG: NADH-quinone oxidoreductase subunit NuoH [Actinomycetaceae bacterium]|nr:NADH-quinone oxidoreductase subunit NuoH [Actinomycetaceae bacterium]
MNALVMSIPAVNQAVNQAVQPAAVEDIFVDDTWWIALIKAVFIVVFLIVSVILGLWVERRLIGRIQTRPGPNVRGPLGLFQALGDAGKLIFKEDFWLRGADTLIYLLAPIISATTAFAVFGSIPFGPVVNIFGISTPLQLFDSSVTVLIILAITSVGVYGIVLGGWSANSPYPLLGAVRSTAQIISYELAMGLSLVSVFLVSGSMSTSEIVEAQSSVWWCFTLLPAFIIYMISVFGETNRLPFDLTECEGELVAGYMTEYSSMKFAWYYLAEYINMFNVSAVAVTLFLGGWRAPFGLSLVNDGMFNEGFWPMLWFLGKLWVLFATFVWVRGTLVRFRYDQFMNFGWKRLIPIALLWLVAVAVIQAFVQFSAVEVDKLMIGIAAVCLVAFVILWFVPEKKPAPPPIEGAFDPMAGGFPVPPMPGQVLPPSPRAGRMKVAHAITPAALGDKEGHNE